MASNSTKFHGLLQRPYEPMFLPKSNGQVYFDLPDNYLTDRYRPLGQSLQNRFGSNVQTRIPVQNITAPDITFAQVIPRRGGFSVFNQRHRQVAGRLIEMFLNQNDADTLCAVASYCRDRLNGPLFQYALSVALQHRTDTAEIPVPSFLELFPDRFIEASAFPQLQEEGRIVNQGDRMAIDIPVNYTASDRELEQRMAYWREDIGVNLHHWHWHLVYPAEGPDVVVRKDRRGELFYYMHQQTMARYNIERFCNGLSRVRPFAQLREPIPDGYYPKITQSSNNRSYPGRGRNQLLNDLNRVEDQVIVSITDMETWTGRIFEAIDSGSASTSDGRQIPLDNKSGIDVLGNMVENSSLSPNVNFYGRLHNEGHNMLAYVHDPDNSFLEKFSEVVGAIRRQMRDPVFYRLHQHIDDIFQRHKRPFQPYTKGDLSLFGVESGLIHVQLNRAGAKNNILLTFWQRSQVDLGAGLDFGPEGNVFATFTHIQHAPFTYRIEIKNESRTPKRGTVRLFMGPRTDEKGNNIPFGDQRRWMIELDKFTVNLNPGENNVVRRSEQSSVTIPYERTFRNIAMSNQPESDQFRFCNCGWPSHMLLPKGTPQGQQYDLFVMVSNFNSDTVNQEYNENTPCDDSHSFCGLRDRMYPDARNMGFPFDRVTPSNVSSLKEFVKPYKNMATTPIQIRFTNTVIARS
uniref:Prophenol oxidase n=1 Tax=Aedes aegypti TaxID=7159 RepID=Q8WSA8_AEDAE|nr:prophenol oxidase [Aedes aegypti]